MKDDPKQEERNLSVELHDLIPLEVYSGHLRGPDFSIPIRRQKCKTASAGCTDVGRESNKAVLRWFDRRSEHRLSVLS